MIPKSVYKPMDWIVVAKKIAYIGMTTNELVKSVDCVWSGEILILNEDFYEYLMRAVPIMWALFMPICA